MITQIKKVIDSTEETGNLPQMDVAWTTKSPLYPGKVSIGSYVVPSGKRSTLKGFLVTADYQNCARTAGLGAYGLTTIYFTVDGTTKGEWRLNHCGYDFGSVGLGQASINLNGSLISFEGAMDFTAGQVLKLLSSPIVAAGCVPQILHRISVVLADKGSSQVDAQKAFAITTLGTASQEIWSYTIPTGGRRLKAIACQAMGGDYNLGMARVTLNGLTIMEFPLQAGTLNTCAGLIRIPFYNGIYFNEGDRLEFLADPPESLNQIYQMIVWGSEETVGGGGNIFITEG